MLANLYSLVWVCGWLDLGILKGRGNWIEEPLWSSSWHQVHFITSGTTIWRACRQTPVSRLSQNFLFWLYIEIWWSFQYSHPETLKTSDVGFCVVTSLWAIWIFNWTNWAVVWKRLRIPGVLDNWFWCKGRYGSRQTIGSGSYVIYNNEYFFFIIKLDGFFLKWSCIFTSKSA